MPNVRIPLDRDREELAKQEISNLSNDAVVYMLHLAILAMGLGVSDDREMANEVRKVFASISYGLVMGDGEEAIPDSTKLEVKELVQNMFSLMPDIVH